MPYVELTREELEERSAVTTPERDPYEVNVAHLCIPLPDCLRVELGPVSGQILKDLENRRYDQAPVSSPAGNELPSLVLTTTLRALRKKGLELTGSDLVDTPTHGGLGPSLFVPIRAVLEHFVDHNAAILRFDADPQLRDFEPVPLAREGMQREPVRRQEPYLGEIYGLATLADLNKHEIRRAAYELLLDIESALADLIKLDALEPWEWIDKLPPDERNRIVGYWKLAERDGVEINPISGTFLPQMLKIAYRSEWLKPRLGLSSRNQFDREVNVISEFRNSIMHPVRPLISHNKDVRDTIAAIDVLMRMHSTIYRA